MTATIPGTDSALAREQATRAAVVASLSNADAEVAVIGSCLLDTDAARVVTRILKATDFAYGPRAAVFEAIANTLEFLDQVDIVTVSETLRARGELKRLGGTEALLAMVTATPSASHAESYARIVHKLATQRRLRDAAESLQLAMTAEAAQAALARVRVCSDAVSAAERSPDATDGAPLDFADIAGNEDPPEAPTLVEHLIGRPAVVMFYGPPQSGKSWAVMNLCMDLVGGGGCFAGADHLQIRPLTVKFGDAPDVVLWVYGSEDTPARVQSRQRTSWYYGPHAGKDAPRRRFYSVTPPAGMSIAQADGVRWLREQADAVNATVVILDTIGSLCGATLDVSKNEQVIPFMLHMQALRNSGGGRIVGLLHHTNKAPTDAKAAAASSKADRVMGSSAWRAQCDAMVLLDAQDGETSAVVRLQSIKAKDITTPTGKVRLTLESPSARFRVLEETEEPVAQAPTARPTGRPKQSYAQTIIAALSAGQTVTLAGPEALDLLDISPKTWKNVRTKVQKQLLDMGVCVVQGAFKINQQDQGE